MQQKTKNQTFPRTKKKKNTYAYNNADKLPEIDFFYADIHSNLKFHLKNPMKKKITNAKGISLVSILWCWSIYLSFGSSTILFSHCPEFSDYCEAVHIISYIC